MTASENSTKGKVNVRVLFFGAARDVAGHSEVELTLAGPTNAAGALEQLLTTYPELRRFGRSLLFAVNQEYAPHDCQVQDGDELALFPPVSGGVTADFFELTTDPIDVNSVARRVVLPECGATVTLDGYAREWTR